MLRQASGCSKIPPIQSIVGQLKSFSARARTMAYLKKIGTVNYNSISVTSWTNFVRK